MRCKHNVRIDTCPECSGPKPEAPMVFTVLGPQPAPTLYHPCKETCSGWKQGFDEGRADYEKLERELAEANERASDNYNEGQRCYEIIGALEQKSAALAEALEAIATPRTDGNYTVDGDVLRVSARFALEKWGKA